MSTVTAEKLALLAACDPLCKLVYYACAAEGGNPGGDGWVQVSPDRIQRWASLSEETWDRCIQRLVDLGLAETERAGDVRWHRFMV